MTLTSRFITTFIATLITTAFSAAVLAEISLVQTAEVEQIETNADGKETVKLAAADKVLPGDTIVYTITATNTGKEAANAIVINNAISEHNLYLGGSASSMAMGKNTTITFSADGGKTFADAAQVTLVENGEPRLASPEEYTHIRWQLNFELAPGKSTKVFFKALVK